MGSISACARAKSSIEAGAVQHYAGGWRELSSPLPWHLRPDDLPFSSRFSPAFEGDKSRKPKGAYILIVEDNSADVELLRWSMREHGMDQDVVVIADGDSAVRYIERIDAGGEPIPALIVLDLNLPKRTGLEVLKAIRASIESRSTPVAVFSSSNATKDVQDSARLGANRYIRKPSNLDEFLGIAGQLKSLIEGGAK